VKVTSFALLALLAICSTASAQLAPQRTWPELKEAVQERANRNAYPMTGMKSEDVREILSQINSLDRDEWAAAWSRMGERYQARAAEQERTDPKAASESYLVAFRYFAFGGWPTPNSAGKKAAFENSVSAFRKHAQLSDPPIEYVRFPHDGKEVRAYLALPKGVRPAPVVLAIGGLDSYKEY
jgi:esterase FrsA